jgi:hypothetical protein
MFSKCCDSWLLYISRLIIYCFTSRLRIFHRLLMLQYLGLSSGSLKRKGDLYRATPGMTQGFSFSGIIRSIAPFSHLLWHTRGCLGPILTRNLIVNHSSPLSTHKGLLRTYSDLDPYGSPFCCLLWHTRNADREDLERVYMVYEIYEMSYGILCFPEPWRRKYSNPVTNFINFMCHIHECKILFITHLSLIWLNA